MSRAKIYLLGLTVVLYATPVSADVVTETGTASFINVGLDANDSHFGSVIYDNDFNGTVTVTGTISNWTGNVNDGWEGLWSSIGLTPTHFFNMSGTTVTGYAHLGESDYGDTSHQMGLAANGMVFYERKDEMKANLQDYVNGGNTDIHAMAADTTFDFELVYDFVGETVSATFEDSAVASRDISGVMGESDAYILQIFATNNDPTVLDMGYDLNYSISQYEHIPGDANRDRTVNGDDAVILAQNWLSDSGVGWGEGDFNDDGIVNEKDVTLLAANWTASTPPPESVPEPSSMVLLLATILTLGIARRLRG